MNVITRFTSFSAFKNIRVFYILLLFLFLGTMIGHAQSCVVNAGVDQTICGNQTLQLDGNSSGSFSSNPIWTQVSGPSVIISDTGINNPVITGYSGGNTYVFKYSAVCQNATEPEDFVTVVVNSITTASTSGNVNSCPDNTGAITVTGNSPGSGETGIWSIVGSNDAGVTINFPGSTTTTLNLSETNAGTTTLRWTLTNSGTSCSSFSDILVTNFGGESTVDAGPDQNLSQCYTATQSTSLSGSFGGNNINGQQGTWIFVTGPSTPTIANINSPSTSVSNLIEGTYTFRWDVSGPCVNGNDTVDIIVPGATQDVTTAVVQNDNQRFCDPSITSATLIGSTPDFTNETVEWEQIDGNPPVTIVNPFSPTTQVTGLNSPNSYRFRYTITNNITGCTSSDTGRVRFNNGSISIVVNSGNDIVGVCDQTSFSIPFVFSSGNRTEYSIISGPSDSSISFPTAYQNAGDSPTTINAFDVEGNYTVSFRRRRVGQILTSCDEATDAINVSVSLSPSGASAGSDQVLNCGETTATLAGSPVASGIAVWSQVSGPNTAVFSDIYEQSPTISGLVAGLYTFRYSVSGGPGCPVNFSDPDTTVLVSSNINGPSLAGSDQTICIDAPVQLAANTPTDDQTGTWSQTGGPAGVVFSDINDPNATATGFSSTAIYTLQWSVENSSINCGLPVTSTLDITTTTDVSPVAAEAGPDQCESSGTTIITLAGNDPPAGQQGIWTVAPSAGVTFADATQFDTTATVPTDGAYTFTWTIDFVTSNGCGTTSDDVEVTIADTGVFVSAGLDQTICLDPTTTPVPLSFTMAADIPPSPGVGTWILVSGNAGYTVDNANSPTATFSDLLDGTYVFEWRIDYGDCAFSADEVTINVGVPPTTANIPGGNQVLCGSNSTIITADPLLNPLTESGVWTVLSGAPNTPSIDDPSSNTINVTGLTTGSYTFRWTTTGSSPLCTSSSADVIVDVYAAATAGADQNLCLATSVFLEATTGTTGTWTIVSTTNPAGTAGFAPIQSPSNSNTANAPVDPGFEYVFEYTTDYTGTGITCNNSDQVTFVISNGPSEDPDAGDDQDVCIVDATATLLAGNTSIPGDVTSEWRLVSQPSGGAATIATPNNSITTDINNLTVPGLYIFELNFESNFCLDKADIVRVEVFEAPTPIEAGPDQPNACQLDAQLAATAPTIGIGTWVLTTDPSAGQVQIDSPNNPLSTISNIPDDAGNDGLDDVYVFTWTVSNGPLTSGACAPQSDTVTLTFTGAPPSIADAGTDQELCDASQTNLDAAAVSSGIGIWTQISGPNTANIASPNNPNSLIFGLIQGTYEFAWTTNGGGCSYTDTMEVTVLSQPVTAEAGPNQTIVEFATLTLDADDPSPFTGTWTQVSGPNTASILNPNSFNSQVTGTTVGTYIFQWTVTNGICSVVSDTVQIDVIGISDLELTKSVNPTSAKVGETILFTIDLFNNNANGNSNATGVIVQDFIPSGYTLVFGTVSNGGVYNAGNFSITWSNLTINNGNTVSLTFQATVNATGNYNNTAQVTASDQFDPDSTPNNNLGAEDDQSSVAITILPNDPPVADNDSSLGNTVGATVLVNIIDGDTDVDGTVEINTVNLILPGGETNVITDVQGDIVGFETSEGVWFYNDTTGLLSFDPADGFTGDPVPIQYTVDDNDGNTSNQATVTITYTPVDPIAVADENVIPTSPGDNTVLDILTNDTLGDGSTPLPTDVIVDLDPSTPGVVDTSVIIPNEGTWTYDPLTGLVTFVPDANLVGNPSIINYTITDADNNTAVSAPTTITINYQSPPVAVDDDSLNNAPVSTANLDLTANDTDADGNNTIDPTSVDLIPPGTAINIVTDANGNVISFDVPGEGNYVYVNITGILSFNPEFGFLGDPTDIQYTVDDNDGNISNQANINITYIPATAPIATNDANAVSTPQGADTVLDILANDTLGDGSTPTPADVTVDLDPGTAGVQNTISIPGEGTWTYNPSTGELSFAPEPSFTGSPTAITYELTDVDTGLSDTATVTVTYQELPVAVDDSSTANTAGATVVVDITVNDTDADGTIDDASVNLSTPTGAINITTDGDGDVTGFEVPGEGVWSYDGAGNISFAPAAGFTGNPTDITYTVDDNDGNTSNAATVNIEYTATNPVATNDANAVSTPQGADTVLDILANDTLGDGSTPTPSDVTVDLDPGTAGVQNTISIPGEGTWTYNPSTGELSFAPESGFDNDPTPIVYELTDLDTGLSDTATVTLDYLIDPVAVNDESLNNNPNNDVVIAILSNDNDPDGTLDPNGVNLIVPTGAINVVTDGDGDVTSFEVPGEGLWTYDPAIGDLTFAPEPGFITDPTPISYTVADNDGNISNEVTVVVDYVDVADLSLTKVVVDNDVTPFTGTEITFEIRVTNDGPANATGVIVEDLLPDGYDFILYSSTTGFYDENTGVWTVGNLASGSTETLLIDVLVNETGNYLNDAEITATDVLDLDSTPNNGVLAEDDQDEVNVIPQLTPRIDLSVTKTANTMTPDVGGQIVFTMTVTNDGPSDATNVVVTDLLASGYEYLSNTVTIGSYEPLNGSWTIGNLPNGTTETITITARVLESGDYSNKVEVTDATEPDIDSVPANNDDTEDDQQTIEPVPVSVSDLALTKTVNNPTPNVGETVQFEILVENLGLSDARGIEVTDLLPSGYTFVSFEATAGIYDEVTGLWRITRTLVQGDIERLTITAIVNPTGDYNNTAAITASDNNDSDITNNDDNAITIPVPISDLSLTKVVDNLNPDVTDLVTFTLTLTNDGPSEATGIVVTDALPSGFNWVSDTSGGAYDSTTGLWSIASLASGASTTIDITVSINTTGSYLNVAEVTAVNEIDPDSTPNNNVLSEDDQDEVQVFPRVITDIEVTKTVDNLNPTVGSQITFTVTVTNNGPSDATGIVVEDQLASGYQFVSATASAGIYDEAIGSWNVGNLANGITETINITVTVLPTGNYNNTAELIALDTFDPDSNPDNNIDSEDDQETINPRPTGLADLSITKSVDNATPLVGDMVEFTINLTNSGDSDATGVVVTDLLPAGYTFSSYISTAGLYNEVDGQWTLNSTVVNGNTESLIILAEVNSPSGIADEYINNVEITAADQADPDSVVADGFDIDDYADGIVDDDEATVIVTPQTVDIAVSKTVDNSDADIGDTVVFVITATNNSTVLNATNVVIQDALPSGYEFVSATTSSGIYDEATGFWTIAAVDASITETLSMTVTVLDADNYVNVASLISVDQSDVNPDNDQADAMVSPQCLTIFNEFSPNGDGTNDFFTIDCISRFPNNKLEVYNRWGNIVFEANGYNNDWDGTSNGRVTINPEKKLPVGTYYYILNLGDGSEPRAGWLYINR
ncbi:PKD domain-containing protein [Spongiivirga citrea]|uniref:DUF11 domain-containing protein n=1 Tax=Spongiivirga citrea TaxID=1481457 RepID=A0A6M0CPR1_9FLAO|nr:gliding motility-associated C-terminal domain-containing protein [Spongiivirga citrea]NER17477.1 DUF11 domain-containing protein [Spongiivirga citrea]